MLLPSGKLNLPAPMESKIWAVGHPLAPLPQLDFAFGPEGGRRPPRRRPGPDIMYLFEGAEGVALAGG